MTRPACINLSLAAFAALTITFSAAAAPNATPLAPLTGEMQPPAFTPAQAPALPSDQDEEFQMEFELPEETLKAIEGFSEMIAPMLDSLGAMFEDLPQYEAPEILPNGDIIIRRKRSHDDYPPYPPIDEPGDQTKT